MTGPAMQYRAYNSRRHAPGAACILAVSAACMVAIASKVFAAPVPPQDLPARLREIFSEGVEAEKAGRLDAAEHAFLRVLRDGGKVAYVYNNLGTVYQQRGDHRRAIAQFREAIRLKPDYPAPHTLMGASLLALGDVSGATRELETAVKLQPREPWSRIELAKACDRAGKPAGAVEQFRILRDLYPGDPEYPYQLGRAYLKLSAWCLERIIKTNPHSVRVYQAMGENYRDTGRMELAVRAFQRALEADPKHPGIHLSLAEIYLHQGNPAEARREVEAELSVVPESAEASALKQRLDAAPK
jgi:Flp pilus assembly protein TadD